MSSRPYHRDDLPGELVAATRAIVEGEGSAAVTVARVAAACHVSVAAPYRHFEDKRSLLGAVAAEGFGELLMALEVAAQSGTDDVDRLLSAGVAYVRFATGRPHMFQLMFDAERRTTSVSAAEALAGLAALLEPLDLRVDPTVALRTTWAVAHGLAALRMGRIRTFDDDSDAELRAELSALVLGILRRPDGA